MLAAAAAWDGLAAELYSAATSYHTAVTGLTSGPWLGPASASMAAAAATNVAWMTTTAAQAEQTAAQAKAAAAAFEAALAMTVPPPVIAANRSLLAMLVATNSLGQNTPAIMATEAHYMEMWAQDAAAMYGYAGASAAATTVTRFNPRARRAPIRVISGSVRSDNVASEIVWPATSVGFLRPAVRVGESANTYPGLARQQSIQAASRRATRTLRQAIGAIGITERCCSLIRWMRRAALKREAIRTAERPSQYQRHHRFISRRMTCRLSTTK
jgi:hypothetical protein